MLSRDTLETVVNLAGLQMQKRCVPCNLSRTSKDAAVSVGANLVQCQSAQVSCYSEAAVTF
jgi:hypothetical protein